MLKKINNLRMRTQIIIFQILVLLFVIMTFSIGNVAQQLIFQNVSSASSSKIMEQSDLKEIGQASTLISKYILQRHQRSILLIEHLAQFIYFFSNNEERIYTKYKIDPCVTIEQYVQRSYLTNVQKFCYQIHQTDDLVTFPKNDKIGKFLYNGLSLLNDFGVVFDVINPDLLQIVDIVNTKFDSLFPLGLMIREYDPTIRPWYKNHIKKMELYPTEYNFFSDVYLVLYDDVQYQFSITQSIFNKEKQVIGMIKTQLDLSDEKFRNINHNILLINSDGQVLYNGLDQRTNIKEIFYIYNQSITGFNSTDWILIQQKSNIHNLLEQQDQYFTLFDKYSQEYVHVHCQKLQKENFTFIIYTNITTIKQLQNELQNIKDKFDFNISITNLVIILFGLLLSFISIIVTKYICQPLVNLNNQISKHILTLGNNINQQIFKLINKQDNSSNILTNLNFQFQNFYGILLKNQNKKSEQCKLIEKMKYNLKECNIDLSQMKFLIQHIPNGDQNSVLAIITFMNQCNSQFQNF